LSQIRGLKRLILKNLPFQKFKNFFSFVYTDLKSDAADKAGTSNGFIGCLKDVQIGRQMISVQSEHEPKITKRKNLVECSDNPCSRMPCANDGACFAHDQGGYRCHCKSNFTGKQCQRPRDECHPNPCQNYGHCVMDDLKGFLCKCKPGFAGRMCETLLMSDEGKRYRKR
jgi:hypothetical protein